MGHESDESDQGEKTMNDRRAFLAQSMTVGAATLLSAGAAEAAKARKTSLPRKFQCRYAPHFGMFKATAGEDLVAQLNYMADQGFTALEDNGLMPRPALARPAWAGRSAGG